MVPHVMIRWTVIHVIVPQDTMELIVNTVRIIIIYNIIQRVVELIGRILYIEFS